MFCFKKFEIRRYYKNTSQKSLLCESLNSFQKILIKVNHLISLVSTPNSCINDCGKLQNAAPPSGENLQRGSLAPHKLSLCRPHVAHGHLDLVPEPLLHDLHHLVLKILLDRSLHVYVPALAARKVARYRLVCL